MSYLSIPKDELAGLTRLAKLSDPELAQLRTALAAAPVLLSREAFLESLAPVGDLSAEDQEKIVSALTYLNGYLATGNYGITDFVSDVVGALDRRVPVDVIGKLQSTLPSLLEIDTLRLRAKAVDLLVDHPRVFQNARILTDVRPVFAVDATSEVKSGLVFHSL